MKKTIALICVAVLLWACGTKTKQVSEKESKKTEIGHVKQSDSLVKAERTIKSETEKEMASIKEMNSQTDTETETKTHIDYQGGEPLELDTPTGRVRIKGNGKMTMTSSTASKKTMTERQELRDRVRQYKLDSVNYALRIEELKRESKMHQETIDKERNKSKEVRNSTFGLWIALIVLAVLCVLFCYLWLKEKAKAKLNPLDITGVI